MNLLNTICSYGYECIKNEDVLEKDISINVRSKAILYPFDDDPFIFKKNTLQLKSKMKSWISSRPKKPKD